MMPRPLGSTNRPGTRKPGLKTSSNKRTAVNAKFNDHEQALYDTTVKATTMFTKHGHKRLQCIADHNSGAINMGAALSAHAASRDFDGGVADAIGGPARAPIEGVHCGGIIADNGYGGPEIGSLDVGAASMYRMVATRVGELTGIATGAPMHSSSSNAMREPQQRAGPTAAATTLFWPRLDSFVHSPVVSSSTGMGGDGPLGIVDNGSSNGKARASVLGNGQAEGIIDEGHPKELRRIPEADDMDAYNGDGGGIANQSKGGEGGRGKGDSGQRLSPAMNEHVRKIKSKIDANIRHKKGKGIPTQKGLGYPFAGPVISPLCVDIEHSTDSVDASRFHLKTVFAWIPEYLWPDIVQFVPCPNCGSAGKPDGWTPQQPRRAFLAHGIGYIIGFRYKCPTCAEHNKRVCKEEKRRTSYHAWDPQCLQKLPDDVSREFPFVSTRKSAVHVSVLDRLAEDLLDGKDFANTATDVYQVYLETFAADKETFRTLVESYRLRYTGNDTLRNAVARDSIRAPTGSAQSQGEDPLLAAATLEETPATEDPTYDDLFGSFHDPLKYSGAAPTESYLQHVWRIWFKDLSLQTPVNLPWTREDYQRRVLHLWNSSTPPPQPPALAIDVATLCAPIPLAPLALPHQWTQVSSSRLGDSTLRPQMPVVQPPPHLDADAAREQHRGLLHLASSSSSSSSTSIKTSRLCGPDDHLYNIGASFQRIGGALQNSGGFQSSGI